MKNNKGLFAGVAVALTAVLAWLAFGFFGIQAAFIDDVVDEGGPVFDLGAAAEVAADPPATTDPIVIETEAGTVAVPVPIASAPAADETEPEVPVAAEPASEAVAVPVNAPQAEAPVETPAETAEEPSAVSATPGEVRTIFSGNFESTNGYSVTGDALVLNNGTDQRFLRFENFESDNGPDLKVYLRSASGEFISLGDLSGNIGNQNYEIPVGVDLDEFSSVEIWCERFSRGFGVATLTAS